MQFITNINQKGQVVIPAKIRRSLKITQETPLAIIQFGDTVVLQSINQLKTGTSTDSEKQKFLDLLDQVQGLWGKTTKAEVKLARQRRQKVKTRIRKLQLKW